MNYKKMEYQDDLNIQAKLDFLLKTRKKQKIQQTFLNRKPVPQNQSRIFSYSRTLRHYDEIKRKVGQLALDQKVIGIYQRQSNDNSYHLDPDRSLTLRPSTQDYYTKPKVSENTQTEEMNLRLNIRPQSEQNRRPNSSVRQNQWIHRQKFLTQSVKISFKENPVSICSNKTINLELSQLYEKPLYQRQEKKTKQNLFSESRQRAQSQIQSLYEFYEIKRAQTFQQCPFRFSQDHKKKKRVHIYKPIVHNEVDMDVYSKQIRL